MTTISLSYNRTGNSLQPTTALLTAIVSVIALCHAYLPGRRIKVLNAVIRETRELYDDAAVSQADVLSDMGISSSLTLLERDVEELRMRVYIETTTVAEVLALIRGLSTDISMKIREAKELRALLTVVITPTGDLEKNEPRLHSDLDQASPFDSQMYEEDPRKPGSSRHSAAYLLTPVTNDVSKATTSKTASPTSRSFGKLFDLIASPRRPRRSAFRLISVMKKWFLFSDQKATDPVKLPTIQRPSGSLSSPVKASA